MKVPKVLGTRSLLMEEKTSSSLPQPRNGWRVVPTRRPETSERPAIAGPRPAPDGNPQKGR